MRTPPSRELERRISKLQKSLKKKKLDAYIVYDRPNSFYLMGIQTSLSYLLVTAREALLLVDGRYIETVRSAVNHCEVDLFNNFPKSLKKWQKRTDATRIGFEGSIPWAVLDQWAKTLPDVEWVEAGETLTAMRTIKSRDEIRRIEKAAKLTDDVYTKLVKSVEPGMTEIDVRSMIHAEADRLGADAMAFDVIVGAGETSSRPHYQPADRPLQAGDILLVDMGTAVEGYCSDMTRVFALGKKISRRLQRVYKAVREAEETAVAALAPGVDCAEIDKIARDVLKRYRLEKYFTHGLGHGVGIQIHEQPRLGKRSKDVLKPGMVVTVEPGVYLSGVGGVRIEDLVLITRKGHRLLSKSSRDLQIASFGQ